MYALTITVPPASEPVTLTEAKAHLRVDGTDDDTLITALITAARQFCELATGRALASQTLKASYDAFPAGDTITLPRSPASAVTGITYYDASNAQQTMTASDYVVDTESIPARVVLAYNASWPSTYSRPNAVSVTFTAGYSSCPKDIRQAMLLLIGHWYKNREAVGSAGTELAFTLDAILSTYRVWL